MKIENVGKYGETKDLHPDELQELRDEIEAIAKTSTETIWGTRAQMDNARYARWEGQSTDGRKHADAKDGKPAFPYEGASDGRIRLADMLVNEREMLCVTAATRATVNVTGTEITDDGKAGRIQTLIKWQVANQLGRAFRRELRKVAQWMHGDAPAVAFLAVLWKQEWALRMETVSLQRLADELAKGFQDVLPPEAIAQIADVIQDPAQEEQAVELFAVAIPTADPKMLRKAIRAWREGKDAEFPVAYLRVNRPDVRALRLWEDVFVPTNTRDIQRARVVFVREWLTRPEVEETAKRERWNPEFKKKLLGEGDLDKGQEGATAFPEVYNAYEHDRDDQVTVHGPEDYKGLFEVVTAYWKAARDDGAIGIYAAKLHGKIDVAATKRRILDYRHGQYPFVDFSREVLTNRLLDSRSVTELVLTDQNDLKLLNDSYNDHTSLTTVPPLFTPYWAGDDQVIIAPLAQVKRRRRDDYEWMLPPAYPATNDGARKEVRRRVNEYWGRPDPDVSAELVGMIMQYTVDNFLSPLADAMRMMGQLSQQYMTDQDIARVTGDGGEPIGRSVEEIQGQFDLMYDFDVRNLDKAYILELAEKLSRYVLPMDTTQRVDRDDLVGYIFTAINPQLASRTLRPVEKANQAEASDEEANFAKIAAGIEPTMLEAGQNFALRKQVIEEIVQKNPAAYERLSPESRAILEKRMEHLAFQVAQEKNRMIGRLGAAPALEA